MRERERERKKRERKICGTRRYVSCTSTYRCTREHLCVLTVGEGDSRWRERESAGRERERVNGWMACRVLASHLTTPAVPPPLGLSSILPAARARLPTGKQLRPPNSYLTDRIHILAARPRRFPPREFSDHSQSWGDRSSFRNTTRKSLSLRCDLGKESRCVFTREWILKYRNDVFLRPYGFTLYFFFFFQFLHSPFKYLCMCWCLPNSRL